MCRSLSATIAGFKRRQCGALAISGLPPDKHRNFSNELFVALLNLKFCSFLPDAERMVWVRCLGAKIRIGEYTTRLNSIGKGEWIYGSFIVDSQHSRRSGTDHTVLPAIYAIPASTS